MRSKLYSLAIFLLPATVALCQAQEHPAAHADHIQRFYNAHLNPYLNFHRPCAVPQVITEAWPLPLAK